MGRYIVRRILGMFATLFVVSVITFGLMHAVPGGPFSKEKPVPKEQLANLNARYHLDEPLWKQYTLYIYEIMVPRISHNAPGVSVLDDFLITIPLGEDTWFKWMNFGPTYTSRSRTVNDIFKQQLPISAQLGTMALLVALIIGVPLGILSALRQNSIFDYLGMSVAIFGVSVPTIVLGPLMVYIFGILLKWFPPTGWGAKAPFVFGLLPRTFGIDFLKYAAMPAIALGLGQSAIIARLTRASLLQVTREDYIRTARAKGLTERVVILRHALKNSLIPVATILGPMFATLVTGTFVTETIFGIPGMGRYFVTSITNRDYPVIMGTILLFAMLLVVMNLVVDVLYGYLDPRIRFD